MKHLKILAVDERPEILSFYEILLTGEGFEADIERETRAALLRFKKCPTEYDLVIMDGFFSRKWDGLWLASEIRENNSTIPILLVSKDAADFVQKTETRLFNGFLEKPFSAMRLIRLVRNLLGLSVTEKIPKSFSSRDPE